MVYRLPHAAPASQIPEDRRGRTIGRFCHVCASIYPLHRERHAGRPLYGRDHIASPCAHEGDLFEPGADWWEPAVVVLPEAVKAPPNSILVANSPAKGTEPEATAGKAG
jgi:hypothetical protein